MKYSIVHFYGGVHRMHGATKWLLLFSSQLERSGHRSQVVSTNFSVPLPFWFRGSIRTLAPFLRVSKELRGLAKILYMAFQFFGSTLLPLLADRPDCLVYHAEMSLGASILGRIRFPRARHIYYCYQPPRELYDLLPGTRDRLGPWYFILWPLLATYKWFDRQLVGRMDLVLVWSPEYASYVREIYGAIPVRQLPASVDFDFIESPPDLQGRLDDLGSHLHISKNEKVLLTVSALNWKKNLNIFIDLVAALRSMGLNTRGVIVGEGPERERLERHAKELGVAAWIHITGFVAQENLPLYYHLSDLLVFLEHNAAWTMSTIEAGAARRPVLVAAGGSMNTLVVHGVTGLVVSDISNIASLCHSAASILEDGPMAAAMGEANHRHSKQFSVQVSVGQFLETCLPESP